MDAELLEDLIQYHCEHARFEQELGQLARELALLAAQVADLRKEFLPDLMVNDAIN